MSNVSVLKAAIANEKSTFTTRTLSDVTGIDNKKVRSLAHGLIVDRVMFRWGKRGSTPYYKNIPIPGFKIN